MLLLQLHKDKHKFYVLISRVTAGLRWLRHDWGPLGAGTLTGSLVRFLLGDWLLPGVSTSNMVGTASSFKVQGPEGLWNEKQPITACFSMWTQVIPCTGQGSSSLGHTVSGGGQAVARSPDLTSLDEGPSGPQAGLYVMSYLDNRGSSSGGPNIVKRLPAGRSAKVQSALHIVCTAGAVQEVARPNPGGSSWSATACSCGRQEKKV